MGNFLNSVSRFSFSVLTNSILVAVAGLVAVCAISLTALYMANYVEETAGMKRLRCLVFSAQADCPNQTEAQDKLRAELAAITVERNRIAEERDLIGKRLAGLQVIESEVDEITLFKTHTDPMSDLEFVVGTVYRTFTNVEPKPESHFCYVRLKKGGAGEDRTLYLRGKSGPAKISSKQLKQAGVSVDALAYGRSVCKPQLIGS